MSFNLNINPNDVCKRYGIECETLLDLKITDLGNSSRKNYTSQVNDDDKNYKCMWCSDSVSIPVGIPIRAKSTTAQIQNISVISGEKYMIKEERAPYVYETKGVFCSLNCTLAYWYEHTHDPQYEFSGLYIQKIWEELRGADTKLIPSPPREMLKIFGGQMSHEEFRAANYEFKIDCFQNLNLTFV